ncbi:unnamed protein product [Cuscuta campestris]|uniref:CCHC-type domain-containing protein n=1 Tax=Cuscuta campestris TaxID=132261 RepID=A0A484KS43_9ASTE|nr:unnamed protein product [Cuscuta campestris]
MWNCIEEKFFTAMNKDSSYQTRDQLTSKWSHINHKVQKFIGVYEECSRSRRSGTNDADVLRLATARYQDDGHQGKVLIDLWRILSRSPKWQQLNNPDGGSFRKRSSVDAEVEVDETICSSDQIPPFNVADSDDEDPIPWPIGKKKAKSIASGSGGSGSVSVSSRDKIGWAMFEVPLFDGRADFMLWQCTIQDYLVQQGLELALQDEKPSDMKESEWSTIQKKAVSTIRLALSPQIKVTMLKETSPKKLWETLESKFASKRLTNRLMMRMDLYSLKMEEEDEVTTALKESQRMMIGEESSGDSHLLAVVSVEKGRKKKSDQLGRRSQLRDMSTVRCYYCEKFGHTKNGCPELKEDLQILKEKKGKSKEASFANVITYEDDLL